MMASATLITNQRQPEAKADSIICGYVVRFNCLSNPERISRNGNDVFYHRFQPGCFAGALRRFDTDQISVCLEHLGGRTVSTVKAGDILLQETPSEIWMELDVPDNAWGRQAVRYLSIDKLQHALPRVAFGRSNAVRENGIVI
jgi:hypothetical protein